MPGAGSHFDLAVIGGGPAGTSAAIAAAHAGARVVIFDAKSFPRHKVCGEFVSAESLDVLNDMVGKVGRPLLALAPKLDRARLFLGNRMIEAPISPPAVSITRYDLDAALWSAAKAAGVVTLENTEICSLSPQGPFEVSAGRNHYSSGALIVAAGRWSQFTPDRVVPPGPKWIGIKCHFRERSPSLSTDLYFFDHGYCGVQPVAPDVVNACAMVRSDCATSLRELFRLHSRLRDRSASWQPVMSPVTTAPLIYRRPRPREGDIIFAGDGAAFIDPFVGDGISIALRSGKVAAQSLNSFFSGAATIGACAARYEQEYSREFTPLLDAASRVRSLMSLPTVARAVAFEVLRLPGLVPFVIRKTRQA